MTTTRVDAGPSMSARSAWRDRVPSILLTAVVAYFLVLTPRVTYFAYGDGSSEWSTSWPALDAFSTAGFVTVIAGVAMGRRRPVWGTVLALLPFLAVPAMGGFVWGWWLGLLAIAALAALDGVRRAVVPAGAAALVVAWYCGTETPAFLPHRVVSTSGSGAGYEWPTLLIYLFWIVATVGVAAAVGSHGRSRARVASARSTERHALQIESLAGERARLARDLHDVVAHHVSLVAVRAESAPFLHPDLNQDARDVLAAIATDAREALTELRQVLVVLQRTSDDGERAPQPTAGDVDDLVTSAVAAGQPVDLVGEWRDVPPATGYVLYRAVQEGLTNARRHAPGSTTTLVRTQTDDAAGFRMTNPAAAAGENGRGLIGMRERVEALGGTMTAVVADGRFVLDVVVPA